MFKLFSFFFFCFVYELAPSCSLAHIFLFIFYKDGCMACGCLGDGDQWLSFAGFLLKRSERDIVWLYSVFFHCWICSIYSVPCFPGHHHSEVVQIKELHRHSELIRQTQLQENCAVNYLPNLQRLWGGVHISTSFAD